MIKKIILCILCFMLAFSACVSATEADAEAYAPQEQMMQQGGIRPGGGPMRGGMQPPEMPNGEQMQPYAVQSGGEKQTEGVQLPQPPDGNNVPQNTETQNETNSADGSANSKTQDAAHAFGGGSMQGGFRGGMTGNNQNEFINDNQGKASGGISDFLKEYSTPVTAIILLILAFIFVIFYKRKNY